MRITSNAVNVPGLRSALQHRAMGQALRLVAGMLVAPALAHWVCPAGEGHAQQPALVTWQEISGPPMPPADHRIQYGGDPLQFGDLRLPRRAGPHPVVVVVHGGCWRAENDLQHVSHLSAALTAAGFATWTIEYRRIGNPGGGWPGTFEDVARGAGYVKDLAREHHIDLDRVLLLGHSAGGQLALWLAGRHNLPREHPLAAAAPLPIRGVVSLAGITDLRAFGAAPGYCNESVAPLLAGTAAEVPEHYALASPIELLPLGVPQRLLHGSLDPFVPLEQGRSFTDRARAQGDDAELAVIEAAGHFDLIAPFSPVWEAVERVVRELLPQAEPQAQPGSGSRSS
jgi:acetyl esterase/lipase